MPPVTTQLTTLALRAVGWFILKEEMSGLFNYAEQKIAILKF
jgi:hypothetical protein